MTIGSLPEEASNKFRGREALLFKGNRWSFSELAESIKQAAKGLIKLGIRPGDKVGLWVPNSPEYIHLLFALAKIGAIVIPINPRFRTSEIAYILKQSNSSVLISLDQSGPINYLSIIGELAPSILRGSQKELFSRDLPDLKKVVIISDVAYDGAYQWSKVRGWGEDIDNRTLQHQSAAVDPDGTAFIMYTSGTTGFPKGVMHCHNVIRNITDRANRMAITHNDVILIYLPLFHMLGFFEGPLMSMMTGARMVLTEGFNPVECIDLIEKEKVTIIHGFDTHFKDLTEAQEEAPKDIRSLRTGICASGMSSSIPVAHKVQKVLCPGMVSAYGISEVGVGVTVSFLTSKEDQRCEASGYPAPGYELKVMDPVTGRKQPIEKPGEILVRGYSIMQGYYNMPEETAKVIDCEGWFHTGDMGLIREDGHLRFIGRYKEMLKIGGENVDPMEVERFLLTHEAIHQIAIVGYPDERLAEVAVAFIQVVPGQYLTEADVINYCRGKIASYKIPRHVIFVKEYPMTASGKIQKLKLKEQALARLKGNNTTEKG